MESKTYVQNALVTEARLEALPLNRNSVLRMLMLLVAAAEVADTLKRGIYYGKGLNVEKLDGQLRQLSDQISHALPGLPRMATLEEAASPYFQPNLRLLHGAIGIFGESGEMLEALVKEMMTGELDLANFAEETGDVDWYKAILHDETGIPEERTRATNIAKLKLRYPGKFSSEGAAVRDLAAERAVLEAGVTAPAA
jgi:NTP pyrophosphatase (non-canonical NTP hydrolase)